MKTSNRPMLAELFLTQTLLATSQLIARKLTTSPYLYQNFSSEQKKRVSYHDAKQLICYACQLTTENFYRLCDTSLPRTFVPPLHEAYHRRWQGEPLDYILTTTEFLSHVLTVTKDTLIPRPETEEIPELISQLMAGTPPNTILDLGTGSGCIAVALAEIFPHSVILAVDVCPKALAIARTNTITLGLQDRIQCQLFNMENRHHWQTLASYARCGCLFDLVVTNPPYIDYHADGDRMSYETRFFEPQIALDGGPDGLKYYHLIARYAPMILTPKKGVLVAEIGDRQRPQVIPIFSQSQAWQKTTVYSDISGKDRFFVSFLR
ncbi:MAG: peptide chain release factor N(5)-glutamine methyltransferase [Proteobacteria bacterium]|nr:peptide chain release factor N(5)-glutamine methyltransferase [Pseudomonadota bacterium]